MINIRTIQHYMYCPRRFGLLEIENAWAENVSVVLANIMHENVHSGKHQAITRLF
jgi:CRISPR-associated exonuclease Cas4